MSATSSTTLPPGAPAGGGRTAGPGRTVRPGPALAALALGGFAIGTGEFAAMGLLPDIAAGLRTGPSRAGHLVSAYALGVVLGAPLLAGLGVRRPRRSVLLALMALFTAGNLATALAPGYGTLLAARFASGLPHGAFYGIAALVAADLAGPARRARAVSRVMLGLSIANVAGVPAATSLGQAAGWRTAYAAVTVAGALTFAAVRLLVPAGPGRPRATVRSEFAALRRPRVLATLAVGAIGFGGMFSVYTYLSPALTGRAHLPAAAVPAVLAVFGLGMTAGNLAGGRTVDRAPAASLVGILGTMVLFPALFAAVSAHRTAAVGAVLLLGTGFALVPALQTRLMDAAADAPTLAAATNHSAFNLANALGAFLGGAALDATGSWAAPAWTGSALAATGLLLLAATLAAERRQRTEPAP
ncbi:MFS transporter [Streptacidiphilus sp. ASG 303]|uniref:MFS transporter n=1 Tax=Streptacidiphilus sp. ASG 303 TaxID=2896847 RepID=UPI001E310633|nr:MFS transporter [Streptacidiphilus sp. ASG 303]MCD0484192.1 MFS transporter [Streptacidiphilus sp. ASG 303]